MFTILSYSAVLHRPQFKEDNVHWPATAPWTSPHKVTCSHWSAHTATQSQPRRWLKVYEG